MFELSIYGYKAQTYLGFISSKPKACEDVHLSPRSGADGSVSTLTTYGTTFPVHKIGNTPKEI